MDDPTSDPTVTDGFLPVRADLGGWISGPCLPAHLISEPDQPPMLKTVLAVARLGQELPSWRVAETSEGWTGVRAPANGDTPMRVIRASLPALEEAMTLAELVVIKATHPGWSIRRTEHGRGFTAQAGGPPALHGQTLAELDAAIRGHREH